MGMTYQHDDKCSRPATTYRSKDSWDINRWAAKTFSCSTIEISVFVLVPERHVSLQIFEPLFILWQSFTVGIIIIHVIHHPAIVVPYRFVMPQKCSIPFLKLACKYKALLSSLILYHINCKLPPGLLRLAIEPRSTAFRFAFRYVRLIKIDLIVHIINQLGSPIVQPIEALTKTGLPSLSISTLRAWRSPWSTKASCTVSSLRIISWMSSLVIVRGDSGADASMNWKSNANGSCSSLTKWSPYSPRCWATSESIQSPGNLK